MAFPLTFLEPEGQRVVTLDRLKWYYYELFILSFIINAFAIKAKFADSILTIMLRFCRNLNPYIRFGIVSVFDKKKIIIQNHGKFRVPILQTLKI